MCLRALIVVLLVATGCGSGRTAVGGPGGSLSASEPDDIAFLHDSSLELLKAVDAFGDEAATIDTSNCDIFRAFAILHRMEARGWMMRSLALAKSGVAVRVGLQDGPFFEEVMAGLTKDLPVQRNRIGALLDADERLLTSYIESLRESLPPSSIQPLDDSPLLDAALNCQSVLHGIQESWTALGT